MTAIRVIESTGSLGVIQVSDGTGGFRSGSISAGSNISITDNSSGSFTIASTGGGSTIGSPEDGDYTDGLYTDFTSSTNIGTAVDRFNEVLKALAPTPAPGLDDIDVNQDGTDVSLSFGSSNDQGSASPAYVSVSTTAGHSAVDVNESYATTTTGNHLRAAVFDGTTNIIGELNEDVSSSTYSNGRINYPNNSFGDADVGVLKLEVNGSVIHEIDLTVGTVGSGGSGAGTDDEVNGNGSGFINISDAVTGTFENGNSFASFKHRTGQYKVATGDQRRGWNYARVQHVRTGSTASTNYIEWVNDDNSDALAASGNDTTFTGIGNRTLSGVEYYVSGTVQYVTRVTNAYKYVYDTNNITFGAAVGGSVNSSESLSLSSQAKPSINTGAGEDHTKVLHLTASSALTADYAIGATATATVTVTHPMKSNLTSGGSSTVSNILMYNLSGNSTDTVENFQSEKYRLISGSYGAQSAVSLSGNKWDSSKHMSGSNTGHSDGLLFYIGSLYSPLQGGNSGNFQYANSPTPDNPDYSSASGLRTFYRKFRNTTGRAVDNLSFSTTTNAATLVGASDSIGANNKVRIFFKHPGSTQWLDAKSAFTYHNTSNRSGGAAPSSGAGTTNLNSATNYVTFGSGSIPNGEYVTMKIEADSAWSGKIDSFTVTFGAESARNVAPELSQIDSNTSGTDASLSFGSSLTLAGYSNVTADGGIGAIDVNGDYDASGNRIAVLDGTSDITGDLNEQVSASGNNYVANSWGAGNAHLGSLKLEINGSVVHTFNLENNLAANTDTSGASGTGFNVSAASVTRDTNQIPNWNNFYRTATYTIKAADQRKGYNYARVLHAVTGTDYNTTYVEWVNDTDGPGQSISLTPSIVNFRSDSTFSQSGIKYFVSPKADFVMTGSNVYKYVYSENANAISFPTTTNCSIVSTIVSGSGVVNGSAASTTLALPNLNSGVTDAYDRDIFVTGTLSFSQSSSLPGETSYTMAASGRIHHPLKGNTTSATTTSDSLLVYTSTDNSTNLIEYFNGEDKRMISGSYANQSAVTSGANSWDSTVSVNGADNGHNTGLVVYDSKLVSPQAAGSSGDFRSTSDGGSLAGPTGNPNYSSVTNATRDYIRWFKNETGGSKTDFNLTINGTFTIVSAATSKSSSNKVSVFAKLPSTNSGFSTGWMDIAEPFETGENSDNAGALVGSLTTTGGGTNRGTFGTQSAGNNEYILIKVVADKTWTGNISDITLAWV